MKWLRMIFVAISCIVMLGNYGVADDEHNRGHKDRNHHSRESEGNDDEHLAPPRDQTYLKFCGSCHFAYQPGLLPGASWEKLMSEGHFGVLDNQTKKQIADYLKSNSAENSASRISRKIISSIGADRPAKITDVPYIRKKHDEISPDVFKRKMIGSRSNCIACHTKAQEGDYDDDLAKIPRE